MRTRLDEPPDLGPPDPVPPADPAAGRAGPAGPPGPPGPGVPSSILLGLLAALALNFVMIAATGAVLRGLPAPAPAPSPAPGPPAPPHPQPGPGPAPDPGPPAPVPPAADVDPAVRAAVADYFASYVTRYTAAAGKVARGGVRYPEAIAAQKADRDAKGKALGKAVNDVLWPTLTEDNETFKDAGAAAAAFRKVAASHAAGLADAAARPDVRAALGGAAARPSGTTRP